MNFAGFLELHARGKPQALAVKDHRCCLSFRELDWLASRFASSALGSGLRPGDRVGIYLPNRAEVVTAFLGAMKAGLIPVPLNWRLSGPDLERLLVHCAPALVITTKDRAENLELAGQEQLLTVEDEGQKGSFWDFLAQGEEEFCSTGQQGDAVANLMYSSGTSGTPKAAIHTHRQRLAIASAMVQAFRLSQDDVALAVSPLFHTSGMSVLSNSIFVGCPLILMERWDLQSFLTLLARERVTFMHLISTLVVDIATADSALFDEFSSCVRMTWGGGHSINPALLEEFERRVGGVFVQGYARTEGGLAYNSVDPNLRSFDHHGYANTNSSEIAIFDPDSGLRCPLGTRGEIAVRGDGVSPGYWDAGFIRQPPLYDGGWQPTGDRGVVDESGALRFLGRIDSMIKTGGENVYPHEVEQALLQIEGVHDAVVLGIPDLRWGQKVAALVARSRPSLSASDIEQGARARLGAFKIPRVVVFVPELPKLGNSKIDLQTCRRLLQSEQGDRRSDT